MKTVEMWLYERNSVASNLQYVEEELRELKAEMKFRSTSSQRQQRVELEAERKELKQILDSVDYTLAEIQWQGGNIA